LLVEHLLQQVELSSCHHHDCQQFYDGKIFNLVLVLCYNLGLDDLPLLLEQLVFSYLLQSLAHIDELGVQLVDLALLGQLEQVGLVMGIEVNRDGFVASVGGDEADVDVGISGHLGLVGDSCEQSGEGLILADDAHVGFLWFFPGHFVEELDGFARFLLDIEAEGFGGDAEVESLD